MDEALPLLRKLLSGDVVEHHGRYFDFAPIAASPAPPSPYLCSSAGTAPALRRAPSPWLDGWVGVTPRIDELEALVAELDTRRRDADMLKHPFHDPEWCQRGPSTRPASSAQQAPESTH